MMKKYLLFIITFGLCAITHTFDIHTHKPFNKVIIWGHKLDGKHTHSWIHWAFARAFAYLKYETLWLDDYDNINGIDFSNSLFITEGQVDNNIPLRNDCRYILHNCSREKYKALFDLNNCIELQVYTHKCRKGTVEKIAKCIYQNKNKKTIYMPWATDLLPHEIEANMKALSSIPKQKTIAWIGTIGDGEFGNKPELNPFLDAATADGMTIVTKGSCRIDMKENNELVRTAYMAPAIVGSWQLKEGYIPCRIFKNISYGAAGITNSKAVYKLFNKHIIYNQDTQQLYYDAKQRLDSMKLYEQLALMETVKTKHTYLNRIQHLFNFMHHIKPLH